MCRSHRVVRRWYRLHSSSPCCPISLCRYLQCDLQDAVPKIWDLAGPSICFASLCRLYTLSSCFRLLDLPFWTRTLVDTKVRWKWTTARKTTKTWPSSRRVCGRPASRDRAPRPVSFEHRHPTLGNVRRSPRIADRCTSRRWPGPWSSAIFSFPWCSLCILLGLWSRRRDVFLTPSRVRSSAAVRAPPLCTPVVRLRSRPERADIRQRARPECNPNSTCRWVDRNVVPG